MEINLIRVSPHSIYKFNKKTGAPKNKLANNLVKELDDKIGNKNYIIIFEEPIINFPEGIQSQINGIKFDTIISNK